ncbi:MAG: LemA family protein [Candidatus Paceibacterota bacterium]
MQDSIIFLISLTFLLIIFNSWYTSYRVCKQTKQAFEEFDLQLRRKLELVAELIQEISKRVKKNDLQRSFDDMVKKVNKASLSEISDILTKEMDGVLKSAFGIIKKHPRIISAIKLESIKREIKKIDSAIEEAKEAYFKNVDFLQKWMEKFPFKRFKEWHFDIDKEEKKMESKGVFQKKDKKVDDKEIDDFVASFKKKKAVRKTSKGLAKEKPIKKKAIKKTVKSSLKAKSKKSKK